jgi:putative NIF3 family GTP cyclohydrolase 1 type 2
MTLYDFGPKKINKVVAVSGRGTPVPTDVQYLIDNQVDLFITGEDSEWVREIFREAKINYLAGGHYHTERFGVLALEKLIKEKLSVETEFIELLNDV